MPTFAAPSTSGDSTGTISGSSIESFRTATNSQDLLLGLSINTMENIGNGNIGREGMILDSESEPSTRPVRTEEGLDIKALILRLEARDQQREAQMLALQNNMMNMMTLMEQRVTQNHQFKMK